MSNGDFSITPSPLTSSVNTNPGILSICCKSGSTGKTQPCYWLANHISYFDDWWELQKMPCSYTNGNGKKMLHNLSAKSGCLSHINMCMHREWRSWVQSLWNQPLETSSTNHSSVHSSQLIDRKGLLQATEAWCKPSPFSSKPGESPNWIWLLHL